MYTKSKLLNILPQVHNKSEIYLNVCIVNNCTKVFIFE